MSELFSISDQAKEILEAALFAAGHPLTYARLAQVFEISPEEVRNMVSEYAEEYNSGKGRHGGIMLLTFEDSCQLCTKEAYIRKSARALGIRRGGNIDSASSHLSPGHRRL